MPKFLVKYMNSSGGRDERIEADDAKAARVKWHSCHNNSGFIVGVVRDWFTPCSVGVI